MKNQENRNRIFFGLGTVGRDMFYAFEANTILYFLSDVLSLPLWVFAAVSMVLSVMRIFDAINDPITGLVIDNIRSPWGKFKPAILVGGVLSTIFFLMLFGNIGTGWTFIIVFAASRLFSRSIGKPLNLCNALYIKGNKSRTSFLPIKARRASGNA